MIRAIRQWIADLVAGLLRDLEAEYDRARGRGHE